MQISKELLLENHAPTQQTTDCRKNNKTGESYYDSNDRILHITLSYLCLTLVSCRRQILDTRNDKGDDREEAKDTEEPLHEGLKNVLY